MGKIIGESFDPYVNAQVDIRQSKLGQTNRDNELLTYLTSKTSWIRLASSVDILSNLDIDKVAELGISYTEIGSNLAKNNILQGGNKRSTDSNSPRGGIINNYGTDSTQAYGFNSTSEFGLIPPPSVESFEITPKNNGSLSQAKIKLKCFSKQQFKIIEALYLRLGYHLLLEWGHSLYYDNKGSLVSNPIYTNSIDTFFNADSVTKVMDSIKSTRESSHGNYDALVGRVTNFDWSVNPDGQYDIELSVTSTGDIIESLAISTPLPFKGKEDSASAGDDDEEQKSSSIDKTPLGRMLKYLRLVLNWPLLLGPVFMDEIGYKSVYGLSTTSVKFTEALTNNKILKLSAFNGITPFDSDTAKTPVNNKIPYAENEIIFINGEGISSDYDYYFIKFGALLRIVQNFLLIYNKTPGSDKPIEPITHIDYDFGDNQAYLPAPIFSADPRVCVIPSKSKGDYKAFWLTRTKTRDFTTLNNLLGMDFFDSNNEFACNFMHTQLNMEFVRQCLKDSLTSENEIKLLDFLTKICEGINSSLSNYLQLEPFHDKDTNVLHIVNKANSDKLLNNPPPVTKFRVGLLPQGESSFVKDVSINSTIPPNFATQIAIGAQANDSQLSSASTPFSKWNAGLEDRIFKEKKTTANSEEKDAAEKVQLANQKEKFIDLQESVAEAIYYYNDFDLDEDLWDLEIAIKDFFKIELNKAEKEEKASTPIIIPISLSLTADGISGIKIFQKYTITEDFLPENYQNSVEFIVKGITHTIDNGGWVTKIEGQCIPKVNANKFQQSSSKSTGVTAGSTAVATQAQRGGSSSNSSSTSPVSSSGSTPNADALRLVLNKLGYKEKGEEISNGGDISKELADYTIAVLTEIKSQYPNIKIRVTGGNDKYHQKLNYNSSHKTGRGMDFVISPSDSKTINDIDLLLQGFAAGNRNPAVSFINEYESPTKAATSKHFHIRIGRDKSGFDKIQNAYALADKGQLPTYPIA